MGEWTKDAWGLDQPMPQSPDAERAVLGSILINQNAFYRVANLTDADFSKDAHQIIYRAMCLMVEEGIPLESFLLKTELAKRGLLDAVGGVEYISSLLDTVPDIANVERYAKVVERMSKKRAGVKAGNALMRASLDPESEPEEVAAAAMASLSTQATREDAQARPLIEVLGETYDAMESLRERNLSVSLTSGWKELDDHKVFASTLSITGAPTKHGKSASMVSIAYDIARHHQPTAIFSLESSNREIALRHTSMMTKIPHSRVRDWRTFSERDYGSVADCRRATGKLPLYLTRGLRTVEDMATEIRRLKMVHGLRAVFIDYLQLAETKRYIQSREERLTEVAKVLLDVANDDDVHISALSQLNETSLDDGRRLTIGDLAYAKQMAKTARIVNLFYRPGKANPAGGKKQCLVDWQIEANNEDRTNDFTAHFDEVTQTFAEGTCEQNDCRSLRTGAIQRTLV